MHKAAGFSSLIDGRMSRSIKRESSARGVCNHGRVPIRRISGFVWTQIIAKDCPVAQRPSSQKRGRRHSQNAWGLSDWRHSELCSPACTSTKDPRRAASLLTSARQGSNLVLSLDYSSRYPDDIHRLDYTTLTAGQSCPSWEVIRHAGYDRVNFLNSQGFVSPDYQHTHSIPLSSTTTRVCAVMVWGPSLNTNSNDDNEHFLIEIDITPPLILVHVDNSNSDRPRYFPVADEAIQTDRFGKEAWSFAVGEDRNCQNHCRRV